MRIQHTDFDCDGDDPGAVPPSPDDFAHAWGNPSFPPPILTDRCNTELMRYAPPARMNAFTAMKAACHEACGMGQAGPGDARVYASIVDPVSVLALIDLVEKHITDEEIAALHQIISDLSNYIQAMAPCADADALLLRARQIIGLTS